MDTNVLVCAYHFANNAHSEIDQRRKYTNAPYITHPVNVAQVLLHLPSFEKNTVDTNMIAAAYLHDVVEDTKYTIKDIKDEFGEDIAQLVDDLTDVSKPEDGNRRMRKLIDLDHTAQASNRAKIIKLADLIDNAESIRKYDSKFYKTFKQEALDILEVTRSANLHLAFNLNRILKVG